jgi:hypothetical protein
MPQMPPFCDDYSVLVNLHNLRPIHVPESLVERGYLTCHIPESKEPPRFERRSLVIISRLPDGSAMALDPR